MSPSTAGAFWHRLSFDKDFPFCTSIIIYCNDSSDRLLPHSHVWPRNPSQCRDRGLVTRAVWSQLLPGWFVIALWVWQWKLQLSLPLEIKQQIPFTGHHCIHPVTLCMGPCRTPHTDILSLPGFFLPLYSPEIFIRYALLASTYSTTLILGSHVSTAVSRPTALSC